MLDGGRKYTGYLYALAAFVLITFALILTEVFTKGKIDIMVLSNLFIPLGTGIVMIAGAFFASNAMTYKFTKPENQNGNNSNP